MGQTIGDVIFGKFSVVDHSLFAEQAGSIGLLKKHVPFILFIGEDAPNGCDTPLILPFRAGNPLGFQPLFDYTKAIPVQEPLIDGLNHFCFFLVNGDLSVFSFAKTVDIPSQSDRPLGVGHLQAPNDIFSDGLRFRLAEGRMER